MMEYVPSPIDVVMLFNNPEHAISLHYKSLFACPTLNDEQKILAQYRQVWSSVKAVAQNLACRVYWDRVASTANSQLRSTNARQPKDNLMSKYPCVSMNQIVLEMESYIRSLDKPVSVDEWIDTRCKQFGLVNRMNLDTSSTGNGNDMHAARLTLDDKYEIEFQSMNFTITFDSVNSQVISSVNSLLSEVLYRRQLITQTLPLCLDTFTPMFIIRDAQSLIPSIFTVLVYQLLSNSCKHFLLDKEWPLIVEWSRQVLDSVPQLSTSNSLHIRHEILCKNMFNWIEVGLPLVVERLCMGSKSRILNWAAVEKLATSKESFRQEIIKGIKTEYVPRALLMANWFEEFIRKHEDEFGSVVYHSNDDFQAEQMHKVLNSWCGINRNSCSLVCFCPEPRYEQITFTHTTNPVIGDDSVLN